MRLFSRISFGTSIVLATAALAAASPVSAQLPPSSYTVTGSAKVTGTAKPYRLSIWANADGYPTSLELTLRRSATTGNHPTQKHFFQFGATGTSCTETLSGCSVDDRGGMSTFGRVLLGFEPSGPPATTDVICGGVLIAHRTRRPGTLTGTLRLKTGTAYFGTVRAGSGAVHTPAAIPAMAERYAPNGASCGPTGPAPCASGIDLAVYSSPYIRASNLVAKSVASLMIGSADNTGNALIFVLHEMSANVPKSALKVTSDQPQALERTKTNFDTLAPFADGNVTFRGDGSPTAPDSCGRVQRSAHFVGTISMHFDGYGTRTMTNDSGTVGRTP